MPLRLRHRVTMSVLAAALAACAHGSGVSVAEAARAACEEEHVAAGPEMDACIERMSESIVAARSYRPEPARPAPRPQRPRTGSSPNH